MQLKQERLGPLLVLRPEGEIDHHCAASLAFSLCDEIDRQTPPRVRLDMSAVPFMDSSGLMVVLGAGRRAASLDARFEVFNAQPQPLKVLHAAGLDAVMTFTRE